MCNKKNQRKRGYQLEGVWEKFERGELGGVGVGEESKRGIDVILFQIKPVKQNDLLSSSYNLIRNL